MPARLVSRKSKHYRSPMDMASDPSLACSPNHSPPDPYPRQYPVYREDHLEEEAQ
jgi:hypothetical protein